MPADDIVVVGRVGSPYGVQGWVNLQSFTSPVENLLTYTPWYLASTEGDWRVVEVLERRAHKKGFIAQFAGVADRDAAARLNGSMIGVSRQALPATPEDEFYWRDLVGAEVGDTNGAVLGVVDTLMETGANDVLVVMTPAADEAQMLIPFVDPYVQRVDVDGARIVVDWQADW